MCTLVDVSVLVSPRGSDVQEGGSGKGWERKIIDGRGISGSSWRPGSEEVPWNLWEGDLS